MIDRRPAHPGAADGTELHRLGPRPPSGPGEAEADAALGLRPRPAGAWVISATATAIEASERSSAPSAIARATSSLTAPWLSINQGLMLSIAVLAAFE